MHLSIIVFVGSAAACLTLDIDKLLIDVYYYLDKSSKRQAAFKQMQLLNDLKESKILKHVSTRWLSIRTCLPRLVENWDALFDFFAAEESSAATSKLKEKAQKLRKQFQSPTNKLYCHFLIDSLEPFDVINTELQCDEPKVHVLRSRLQRLLHKLLLRFVKPSAMLYKDVLEVDVHSSYNIKHDKELMIGQQAKDFMDSPRSKLRPEKIEEFYTNVKNFYKSAVKYIKEKLPFKDEVLRHAEVVNTMKQTEALYSSLDFFLKRFPVLIPEGTTRGEIEEEFADYQSTDISKCIDDRMDTTWGNIGRLVNEEGQLLFKVLPKVMVSLLCIPHSSAHCERVFSLVRKNKTEFRSRLGQEILEALVVAKSRSGKAIERVHKQQDLKDYKSAYYRSLKSNN